MLAIFCALRFLRKTDHFAIGEFCVITRDSLLSHFNLIDDASLLVARRHARWEAASWISKLNRVFAGRRVVDREFGPVAIDDHDYDLLLKALNEVAMAPADVISEYVAHGTPPGRRQRTSAGSPTTSRGLEVGGARSSPGVAQPVR